MISRRSLLGVGVTALPGRSRPPDGADPAWTRQGGLLYGPNDRWGCALRATLDGYR